MNMMEAFNRTLDYLESTLDGELDELRVARLSGYPYAMFSRLFSMLTGTSLSEYLRERRLTEAALALRQSEARIIDIAIQYGYESADAFGAAFKKFHGATPTQIRQGAPLRLVGRLQLRLTLQGGDSMKINIQNKPALTVAGLNANHIPSSQCPQIWQDLYSKFSHDDLASLGRGQSLGVCHDIDTPERLNYMAGYEVTDRAKAEAMGLDILEVAAAEYAVVELNGPVPDCIHAGWRYLMEVFFPEQGFQHSGAPDFEVYSEGNMGAQDYRMELWVPIVKVD